MPNWVTNRFEYVSNEDVFNKYACDKDGLIDFRILKPIPNTVSNNDRKNIDYEGFSKIKNLVSKEDIDNKFLNDIISDTLEKVRQDDTLNIPDADVIRYTLQVYNDRQMDGIDWYSWCCENWGTKWNACEPCGWEFDTAWSVPHAWLSALAEKLDFNLWFADEDIGYNVGFAVARNGECEITWLDEAVPDIDRKLISMYIKGYYEDIDDLKRQLKEDYYWEDDEVQYAVENIEAIIEKFIIASGVDKAGVELCDLV